MASETTIANHTLRLLKAQRITSLTDGTKNANVLNDLYTEVRDTCLRAHTWKFGTKLDTMARLATAPTFEYDYAYALPSDWIRTISLHDNDAGLGAINYREAEVANVGALLCSIETAYLKYVYRVTDPNRMAPDFREAFAYALACQAPGISNMSADNWEKLERDATRKMNRAKSTDSLGMPADQRPVGSWVSSRQSWPSTRWPR